MHLMLWCILLLLLMWGRAQWILLGFALDYFSLPFMFSCISTNFSHYWFSFRYYHNITSNTLVVLEAMAAYGVKTLIYSSTCATYGEPEKMPITENTPQVIRVGVPMMVVDLLKFLCGILIALSCLCKGSYKPIWKSKEDGGRYYSWLLTQL